MKSYFILQLLTADADTSKVIRSVRDNMAPDHIVRSGLARRKSLRQFGMRLSTNLQASDKDLRLLKETVRTLKKSVSLLRRQYGWAKIMGELRRAFPSSSNFESPAIFTAYEREMKVTQSWHSSQCHLKIIYLILGN